MAVRGIVVVGAILSGAWATTAGAQFGPGGDLYTPDPEARDLKSVLFNWAWHMGMLRGQAEPELVQTLELRAEGTIQVDGEPCSLDGFTEADAGELGSAGYRISANYRFPGYRTEISCTLPDGTQITNIETASGAYAWDEDQPGAGLVPGEGTVTPQQATWEERMIRLWASPHGAPKAAIAAAAGVAPEQSYAQNPADLLDDQAAAGIEGSTTLEWQGRQPVLSFPLPGIPGALATATLTADFLPESVVVTHGRNTTEFTYSDYADFNNPLHRIEALYAGSVIERQNGVVVRDLRTVQTEIGQVYVVVPVPGSISSAGN